jgi:hypothetical protein
VPLIHYLQSPYHFFLMKTFKILSSSIFVVYSTLALPTVTTVYKSTPEFHTFINYNLLPIYQFFSISPLSQLFPSTSNHHSTINSMRSTFLYSMHQRELTVLVFLFLV